MSDKVRNILVSAFLVAVMCGTGFIVFDHLTNHTTVTNCTVTDTRSSHVKSHKYKLETTCGNYSTNKETYNTVEVGETYDFNVAGTFAPRATL